MIYFTSDLHFTHSNVIRYSNRPFQNVHEMDETLIRNWNDRVGPEDEIYVLGDFCLGRPDHTKRILSRLQGKKFLIKGNHDKIRGDSHAGFEWIENYFELDIPDKDAPRNVQKIVMCHYAFMTWNKMHYGAWDLFGHSHGSLAESSTAKRLDVGVDCHNYAPISYSEVKALMSKKVFKPVDHHGR